MPTVETLLYWAAQIWAREHAEDVADFRESFAHGECSLARCTFLHEAERAVSKQITR
jgi:hypothetical protein